MQIAGQHLRESFYMRRRPLEPLADRLIFVSGDLAEPPASCLVASRSTELALPPQQGSSDHTSAFLAFPQSRSCSSGSDSAASLDGFHCAPRGTLHNLDSDMRAGRPASFFLAGSYFTSYLVFYHPFTESLPKSKKKLKNDSKFFVLMRTR